MAKNYGEIDSKNLLTFDKSFSRANGQPLDNSEIYYSFQEAEDYAKTNTAYIGQKIIVIENGNIESYQIIDAIGTLRRIANQNDIDNIISKTGPIREGEESLDQRIGALEEFTGNASGGLAESVMNTVLDENNAVLSDDENIMPFDPTSLTEEDKNKLVTQGALIERLGFNSEGRSVKYNITQSGWHRILNMIRVDSGMIHFGLCSINNRQTFRDAKKDKTLMQTLGLEISGMVNLRDAQSPILPHPIIQHYNNIFGGANDNALNDTFKITQVRIGFPKKTDTGELVDIIEEDGTNRKYNPVNCYFDIYIDLKDTVETEEKPSQHAITISYYGKSNQHNCETLFSPVTENLNKGLYEEDLEFYNFPLSETYDIYAPNHKANYKEIVTENIYKKEQIITQFEANETPTIEDNATILKIGAKNPGITEEGLIRLKSNNYNLLPFYNNSKTNERSLTVNGASKTVYSFPRKELKYIPNSNIDKILKAKSSKNADMELKLLENGAIQISYSDSTNKNGLVLFEVNTKPIPLLPNKTYITNAYQINFVEEDVDSITNANLYSNIIPSSDKIRHIQNLVFSSNTAALGPAQGKLPSLNYKNNQTMVPYLLEVPSDNFLVENSSWIYPHYDTASNTIEFKNPESNDLIYLSGSMENWYADYINIDLANQYSNCDTWIKIKDITILDEELNSLPGQAIIERLSPLETSNNQIIISDTEPTLEENQIWLQPTLEQPQEQAAYINKQDVINNSNNVNWLCEQYNSGIVKLYGSSVKPIQIYPKEETFLTPKYLGSENEYLIKYNTIYGALEIRPTILSEEEATNKYYYSYSSSQDDPSTWIEVEKRNDLIKYIRNKDSTKIVMLGDFDENDDLDMDDAVKLLSAIQNKNDISVEDLKQDADINGDGVTTDEDAIDLLFYINFPQDYLPWEYEANKDRNYDFLNNLYTHIIPTVKDPTQSILHIKITNSLGEEVYNGWVNNTTGQAILPITLPNNIELSDKYQFIFTPNIKSNTLSYTTYADKNEIHIYNNAEYSRLIDYNISIIGRLKNND